MHTRGFIWGWACALLATCFLLATGSPAQAAQRPRTIVVIVDASASMDDIQLDVEAALIEFAQNLAIGDQCVIFAFGDEVRQVVARDITAPEDREVIATRIADIQATDRFTDITTALERGFRALERNAKARPQHLPMMVLLTDGRHNPRHPDAAPSFSALKKLYGDFVPGDDWYLHYVILKAEVSDPDADAFVESARGALTRLAGIHALTRSLSTLPVPAKVTLSDTVGRCSVRYAAAPGWYPTEAGAALASGMVVETGPDGRAIVRVADAVHIGLDPATKLTIGTATWDPLHETGELILNVDEGVIEVQSDNPKNNWNVMLRGAKTEMTLVGTRVRFSVEPGNGKALVQVRSGEVRLAQGDSAIAVEQRQQAEISPSGLADAARPWPAEVQRMSQAWDTPLDGSSLADHGGVFVQAAWEMLDWDLGPLVPDETWSRIAQVSLAGLDERARAAARVYVKGTVPEGVELTVELIPPPSVGPHELQLTAISAPHYVPEPDAVYSARVGLTTGGEEDLAAFPLKLWTGAATGTATVVTTQTDGSGWGVIAGFAVGGVLIVVFIVGIQRRVGRGKALTGTGRMLVLENPTPDTLTADFIALDPLLQQKRDGKLSVGSSSYCDLVLSHDSVQEHHCDLSFRQTKAGTDVHVETIRDAAITLNDDPCAGRFRIGDRAQLGIGGFTLQYEDSGAKPQVLVHMKDGKAVRGALHAWDLNEPTFLMAPNDAHVKFFGGPVKGVNFTDVQDIAMLRLGGASPRKSQGPVGKTVSVRFPGGRSLEGILWADYNPDAPTFTLFPKNNPEIDYIVVVRANAQSVDTGDEIPDYPDHLIP